MGQLEKISDRVWVSEAHNVMVSFGSVNYTNIVEGMDGGGMRTVRLGKTKAEIKEWGTNNSAPSEREKLLQNNEILPNLQILQRNLLIGGGMYTYKETYDAEGKKKCMEVEMPSYMKTFFDETNMDLVLETAFSELTKHLVCFPEIVWTRDGRVKSIEVKESRMMRAEKKQKGKVQAYWFSGHFGVEHWKNIKEEVVLERIALYDPTLDEAGRRAQGRFVYPISDMMMNDGYYPIPPIDGVKNWVVIMNKTPIFHDTNLDNTYAMNWHVEIPDDYFYDWFSVNEGLKKPEEAKKEAVTAEEEFIEKMNKFFAGVTNAGRTVYTKFRTTLEKDYPGIKITALKGDMRDEALLKLHDAATIAVLSNQGVPAVLGSIPTPNRMSAGAEIRNTLTMYLIIYAPFLRNKMIKFLEFIGRLNGWDASVKIGFRDVEITKLDENKAGKSEGSMNNSNQNTGNGKKDGQSGN
jgi:hypothetical protein